MPNSTITWTAYLSCTVENIHGSDHLFGIEEECPKLRSYSNQCDESTCPRSKPSTKVINCRTGNGKRTRRTGTTSPRIQDLDVKVISYKYEEVIFIDVDGSPSRSTVLDHRDEFYARNANRVTNVSSTSNLSSLARSMVGNCGKWESAIWPRVDRESACKKSRHILHMAV